MRTRNPFTLCCLSSLFVGGTLANAAPLEEARVSRVIQDVRLLAGNAAPRPASINDDVKQGMAVRTGAESRAELTFTDLTITRLGQNTVFSIKGGTREVALDSGAILLQVPHGGEPANVRTAAVTASISGGTMMISANKNFPTKVLVPEGVSHFCSLIHPNECVDVHGGEMSMMLPDGSLTKPEKFNGKLVYQTAHLLTDFPPLPNEYLFVFNEVGEPEEEPPPNEGDEIDKTDQRAAASPSATESASATPTPSSPTPTPSTPTPTPSTPTPTPGITPTPTPGITPTPTPGITPTPTPGGTPGKFGPPTTIKSPNPYVIDSGTVITTDPSITTNDVTDYGTIYRGPKEDGAFSTWAFGSTSSFDTSSGFDGDINSSGAVFKFSSLVISGNPTVITDQGETDLGLIGVDGISIDIVGDLTFAPIEGLLFATVNGPIFLGSKTSFSGMRELVFYARGETSDLNSHAQMTTLRHVRLYAERDIYLDSQISTEKFRAVSGRDIALNSSDPSAIDAVTMRIFAGRDLQLASGLFTSKTATDSEGEVSLVAEHDISSMVGIYMSRQNGGISDGLNLTLNAKGNDITIGQSVTDKVFTGLTMIVDNDGSDLNSGGNITVNAGGNFRILDGGALYLMVDNSDDAHIGDGGNINVSIGGEIMVPSFYAAIDNSDGGTMDLTAKIEVTAAEIFVAGNLDADILNFNGGGTIGDDARVHFDVPGDLSVMGNAGFLIDNTGGTIGADAKIDIANAPNISVDDGNLNLRILNVSGTIGGNAIIDVVANSIIVGGNLNAYVDNTNGSIGGGGQSPAGGVGSVSLESFGAITVIGRLNVFGTVLSDDDVMVGTLSVTDLETQGNDTIVGAGGITRFSFPNQAPPDVLHTLTTRLLTSAGGINFDGVAADGDFSMATDGGRLIINALILSFGPLGNIVGPVTFNGGNASSTFGPGSGGTFTVNTTSDITVNSNIEATSGYQDIFDSPRGAGGTVKLNASNGTVTVTNRIEVSSNDLLDAQPGLSQSRAVTNRIEVSSNDPPPAARPEQLPARNSDSGGTIGITSGKTTGMAINISGTAQLLAMLDAAAPGPGGNIVIVASRPGNNDSNSSSINIDNQNGDPGAITAERGTVEIRHDGASGVINISSANIFADVVKIGALGTSGTLSIGGGTISANTMLKLYAPGSNGLIEFTSNVLLDKDSTKILAANTITILDGVTVTIGGKTAADVYVTFVEGTPNANYTGSGGNGTTTGTFAGAGANAPQPLASAPPFGGAGTGGSRHNLQVAVPVRQNGTLPVSHIRSPGPTNLPPIRQ